MSGMKTTQSGWEDRWAVASGFYGLSGSSVPKLLKTIDDALLEIDAKLSEYPEASNINYSSQNQAINTITEQGTGLIKYAVQVNEELFERIDRPFVQTLDTIIENIRAINARELISEEAFSTIIDIDYDAHFANSNLDPDFMKALALQAYMFEIDRMIREGLVTIDDPNNIDELLSLEDRLGPELLAILAGITDSDLLALLYAYFEKQIRIQLFEHRAIHNYVRDRVAEQTGGTIEVPILHGGRRRGGGTYGFMDVYDFSTGEVWEVKAYGQRGTGAKQVDRYESAGAHEDNTLKFPLGVAAGEDIQPITVELGDYTLSIYSDAPSSQKGYSGIVLYQYSRTQPQSQLQPDISSVPASVPVFDANEAVEQSTQPQGEVIEVDLGGAIAGGAVVVGIVTLWIVCPPAAAAVTAAYVGFIVVPDVIDLPLRPNDDVDPFCF